MPERRPNREKSESCLHFAELGLLSESAKQINLEELAHYKQALERVKTRYLIVDQAIAEDGSVIVHVKKQYNDTADVSEYFN